MNLLSKHSDFYKRLPVFFISVGVLALLFLGFENLFVQWATWGLLAVITLLALWEFSAICRTKGAVLQYGWIAFFSCAWILVQSGLGFFNVEQLPMIRFVLLVIFFIGTFLCHFRRIESAVMDISATFFAFAYIAIPLGLFSSLLFSYEMLDGVAAKWWILYLLFATKLGDMAGYLLGKTLEGPKIMPKISPHKTYVGSLFNVLVPALASMAFAPLLQISIGRAFLLGLIIAFFGMMGDLAESLLKRDAALKDSNKLGGVGGVLDMIDSLLFSTPVFAIYLLF